MREAGLTLRVSASLLMLGVALTGLSFASPVAGAELGWTSGVAVSVVDGAFDLRRADGEVVPLVPDVDCLVVFAQAIGRRDIMPGDVVGVVAYVVQVSPTISGLIGRSFAVADGSVPEGERRVLVEQFLAESLAGASDGEPRRREVVGALVGTGNGSVLNIRDNSENVSVKLGPEAFGYRLRQPGRQVLAVGARLVVGQIDGKARTIFVLSE